jgi:hypothetical protein
MAVGQPTVAAGSGRHGGRPYELLYIVTEGSHCHFGQFWILDFGLRIYGIAALYLFFEIDPPEADLKSKI